jgi:hypothetical protein
MRSDIVVKRTFEYLFKVAQRRPDDARGRLVSYSTFATDLDLGLARGQGAYLTSILLWCKFCKLPWLPIIVVRQKDGVPSGPYHPHEIEPETIRVHAFDWRTISPPTAPELYRVSTHYKALLR